MEINRMKSSTFVKRIPMLPRLAFGLAVFLGGVALFGGCYDQAQLGDRCNPLRSSDECGSGLHCSGNPIGIAANHPIPYCPENYCCPINADGTVDFTNTNPFCQPGCNGGAEAICLASDNAADAGACIFAACLADADPTSCAEQGGDDAAPTTSDAESSDAETTTDGTTTSEAGSDVVSTPEAASEASTSPEAAPTVEASVEGSTTD
jgi:hypothetical protein